LSSFKAFSQAADIDDLRAFVAKNSADVDATVAAQTLETASSNSAWVGQHAKAVTEWVYPATGTSPSVQQDNRSGAQSSAQAIVLVFAICAVIALSMLVFKLRNRVSYARQNDV
jgi:predicted RND superfamily exporter protein